MPACNMNGYFLILFQAMRKGVAMSGSSNCGHSNRINESQLEVLVRKWRLIKNTARFYYRSGKRHFPIPVDSRNMRQVFIDAIKDHGYPSLVVTDKKLD